MIGERVISVAGCVVDGVLHPIDGLHKLEDNLEAQLWAWLLPELPRPGSSRDGTHRVISGDGATRVVSGDGADRVISGDGANRVVSGNGTTPDGADGRAASRDSADTIA